MQSSCWELFAAVVQEKEHVCITEQARTELLMWKSFLVLFHKNLFYHIIDFPLLWCYLSNKIKQLFSKLLQF